MRKKLWLPILAVLLTGLLFPFETTIVPPWRVQVVDKAGTPLRGVTVTEHWSHSSLEHNKADTLHFRFAPLEPHS